MLAVAAIPKHRCMHNIPWLDSNLPRMVDKLQSIIDEIETQYERLTDLKAEGDTTGFTTKKFGCRTSCNSY